MPDMIIQAAYLVAVFLLIIGLKNMSTQATAQKGLAWAGVGMLIAVVITYFHHDVKNHYLWMTLAILVGGTIALISAKKAAMTDMPQMIALFNGMGGGAAAAIAAVELIKLEAMPDAARYLAILGALVGCVSLSGSFVAYAKLQGHIKGAIRFPFQHWINALILVISITFGLAIVLNGNQFEITSLILFYLLAIVFGVFMTIHFSANDMPIVISLFNTLTGLAVGFEGYVLSNPAMMIAGMFVAAAGIMLTKRMAKAMNRPISHVLLGDFVDINHDNKTMRSTNTSIKELDANDAATMMAFSQNVIIVPGYGMAVAQAQHKIWELSRLLIEKGVNVKFALHPVAGRMPGHMNVLLAETGISYDLIYDIDDINDDFERADVVLLVGANDISNLSARSDQNSPIYGMPILNADYAKHVIIVKRGTGTGFSGIDNPLFYQENARLLYGDAQSVLSDLVSDLKKI